MGSIHKGSTKVNKLYVGSKAVQKVYKGSTLIWSAGEQTYIVYKGKNPWVRSNWMELTESTAYNSNYGYIVMPYTYDGDEKATVFPLEAFTTSDNGYRISRFNVNNPLTFWDEVGIPDCVHTGSGYTLVKTLDLDFPEDPEFVLKYVIDVNTATNFQKYFEENCEIHIGCNNFLESVTPIGANLSYARLPNIFMIYQMWQRRAILYRFLYKTCSCDRYELWLGYYYSNSTFDCFWADLTEILRTTEGFDKVGKYIYTDPSDGDGYDYPVIPFYQNHIS